MLPSNKYSLRQQEDLQPKIAWQLNSAKNKRGTGGPEAFKEILEIKKNKMKIRFQPFRGQDV